MNLTKEERDQWRERLLSSYTCFDAEHATFTIRLLDALEEVEVEKERLEWTDEPQLGEWNWWRDEDSRIPRYVYQDGTVDIAMQIDRVFYQDLGGQWAGPIPEPVEPK